MTHDFALQPELSSRLTAVLSAQPDIVFAALFGSVAKGTARPDSDLMWRCWHARPWRRNAGND